jgi:nucleotide-binding universal stress UspA family protein
LAAKRAAELANAYGDNLHLVMCVERDNPIDVEVGSDKFRFDQIEDSEQFLAQVGRSLGAEHCTHSVLHGDPAKVLCAEAAKHDTRAIVVGNRRVQGVARILGSVAGDVVKHAPCDVLVANTTSAA